MAASCYRFEDLIPNGERRVIFQKYLHFIDEMEIKSFALGDGSVKTLINLKNYITAEDIRIFKLDFRPLRFTTKSI